MTFFHIKKSHHGDEISERWLVHTVRIIVMRLTHKTIKAVSFCSRNDERDKRTKKNHIEFWSLDCPSFRVDRKEHNDCKDCCCKASSKTKHDHSTANCFSDSYNPEPCFIWEECKTYISSSTSYKLHHSCSRHKELSDTVVKEYTTDNETKYKCSYTSFVKSFHREFPIKSKTIIY